MEDIKRKAYAIRQKLSGGWLAARRNSVRDRRSERFTDDFQYARLFNQKRVAETVCRPECEVVSLDVVGVDD